jgi:hypothetical protein
MELLFGWLGIAIAGVYIAERLAESAHTKRIHLRLCGAKKPSEASGFVAWVGKLLTPFQIRDSVSKRRAEPASCPTASEPLPSPTAAIDLRFPPAPRVKMPDPLWLEPGPQHCGDRDDLLHHLYVLEHENVALIRLVAALTAEQSPLTESPRTTLTRIARS